MKDEYGGTHIYEFIGLKSTIFSVRDVNKKKYTWGEVFYRYTMSNKFFNKCMFSSIKRLFRMSKYL